MKLATLWRGRRPVKRLRPATPALRLETLEDRLLLSIDVLSPNFGLFASDTMATSNQPSRSAAPGPEHVVEAVNGSIAFIQRNTWQSRVIKLKEFFAPLGIQGRVRDPIAVYDEQVSRFVVAAMEYPEDTSKSFSFLDVAVSDTSNPEQGFGAMYRVDVKQGEDYGSDPRIGWNADALVIALSMLPQAGDQYTQLVTLDWSKLLAQDAKPVVSQVNPREHRWMMPATMHDSQPGDPMWFVESERLLPSTTVHAVRMTEVLTDHPVFRDNPIEVPRRYFDPDSESQPDHTSFRISNPLSIILTAAWRNNRLVAAHSASLGDGNGDGSVVLWYEFDTADAAPQLTQSGVIDFRGSFPGPFHQESAFYPAMDIAANGDLGLTFLKSGLETYMSMAITGHSAADPRDGSMQPPKITHPGQALYTGNFAGLWSSVSVDPVAPTTFWAANLFKPSTGNSDNWGTGIDHFSVGSWQGFLPPVPYNVPQSVVSVAVGDFDGNNNPDLVTVGGNMMSVLLGNGDGTFAAPQNYQVVGTSVAVGDFNGDHQLDLVIASGSNLLVLLGNGDGTFGPPLVIPVGANVDSVAVGDFNGDNILDIVAVSFSGLVSVLLGNGDGTFQTALASSVPRGAYSVVVGDFNSDNKLDLAVSVNDGKDNLSVLLGNGDGTFGPAQNYTINGGVRYLAVGDFNLDNNLDLVTASGNGTGLVSVLSGNGDGTFGSPRQYHVGGGPTAITVGDFDGDGQLDIAVANALGDDLSVLLGNGDGTFLEARHFAVGGLSDALAAGDFNGDQFLDLAVGTGDGTGTRVAVLLNGGKAGGPNPPGGGSGGGLQKHPSAGTRLSKGSLRVEPALMQMLTSSLEDTRIEGISDKSALSSAWQANRVSPPPLTDVPVGQTSPAAPSLFPLERSVQRYTADRLFLSHGWADALEPAFARWSISDLAGLCLARLGWAQGA